MLNRTIIVILLLLCSLPSLIAEINSNITKLPWSDIFAKYNLSNRLCILPAYKSKFDIFYDKENLSGIWALSVPIAKHYGLRINNAVDERYDIEKSSIVAAKYLTDLISIYINEDIAVLVFLNGAILTNNTAKKLRINLDSITESDFVKLKSFLPYKELDILDETTNIKIPKYLITNKDYTFINITNPVRSKIICDTFKININDFNKLNPFIKDTNAWVNDITICLPLKADSIKREEISQKIEALYKTETIALLEFQLIQKKKLEELSIKRNYEIKKANAVIIYCVKSGDTLGHIAQRYKVSVRQLKCWNNLKSDFLKIGQRLKIKRL